MKKLLAAVMTLAVAPALAATAIQERRAAGAEGVVEISNVAGSVRVAGWRRDAVEVSGRLGDGVERVEFDVQGDRTVVRVHLVRGQDRRGDGSAELLVRVPQRSRVVANTVSAELDVDGVNGGLELKSVSGNIDVRGGFTEADVASVSGGVRLSGAGRSTRVALRSVSGALEFDGPLARDGHYELETVSGRVLMRVHGRPSAAFDLSTFSGEIRNGFGPPAERTSRYAPGLALRFSEGQGGAQVRMRAVSGTLELEQR